MKNIAVLVKELTTGYNITVLEGIESYLKDKDDVRFTVSTIAQPRVSDNSYDYQYWTAVDILRSPEFDAVIVITNSFLTSMKLDELSKELTVFAGKPVFSVATNLNLDNSYYTHTICTKAYDDVVRHLKEKHNKKNIAFFSAGLIDSPDSDDRVAAYKAALEKNGLTFNPDLIYKGDFTPGTARDVMLNTFKSKDEIPFDAMLCANDFTAGGALLAFLTLGVKVPDDVAVIGFDDDPFATLTQPTLSSINQAVAGSGAKAAEMAYRVLCGEKVDQVALIQSRPVYRQSCGCIPSDIDTAAFVDENEVYHGFDERVGQQTYKLLSAKLEQTQSLNHLVDIMNTRMPFSEYIKETLGLTLFAAKITDLIFCLYDNPIYCGKYADFFLPDEANLVLYADSKDGVRFADLENPVKFNPREHIIPPEFNDSPAGKYFLLPVTMHETNVGYMWGRLDISDNTIVAVNLKILTNVLIHAIEYQRDLDQKKLLISRNQTLNMQSKTDELTQILNRRGFFDNGQQLINLSISSGKTGVVFFCDLDGLKTINDTYGHDIGDLAIKTEAQVLKTLFRDSDMVGRLSGDEFGVVAPGMKLKFIPILRERLVGMNEKFSKEAGLPFTLSMSVGPIEFDKDNSDLQVLLSQADDNLYIEKKKKHGER